MVIATVLFCVSAYALAGIVANHSTHYYCLRMPWEQHVPLVPVFSYIYIGVFGAALVPLAYLKESEVYALAGKHCLAFFVAFFIFISIPTIVSYDDRSQATSHHWLLQMIRNIDVRHNACPSLHVCLAVMTFLSLKNHLTPAIKFMGLCWTGLAMMSVIFVHQHHVPDVSGGILLALMATYVVDWTVNHAKRLSRYAIRSKQT